MLTQKEGKQAQLQELSVRLQLVHRYWQRNKLQLFYSELASASDTLGTLKGNTQEWGEVLQHVQAAKTAADQKSKDTVTVELSKAIALTERMRRLGK